MPVILKPEKKAGHNIVTVQAIDQLTTRDYEHFVPELEKLIAQNGVIRVLLEMHDFHGWSAGALWEDIKFDLKHFSDIERLALVGDKKWEEWMAKFCKPFVKAEIRYFDQSQAEAARNWLEGD